MRSSLENFVEKHGTKVRYLVVGAANTAFGLAIFPLLFLALQSYRFHYVGVFIVSQVASVTFAYITNKFAVFKTRGNYIREYGKFVTFYASYAVFNLLVLSLLVEATGASPVWVQPLCAVMVVILSYAWHSRITFKSTGDGLDR